MLEQVSLDAAIGETFPSKNSAFLAQNGYVNAGTVREAGEFAVRGGIVDLFPPGYDSPLRLDFFGDEIESIRVFDPLTQTTTDKITRFHLGPIAEAILSEAAIAHFRSQYRALFGAVTDGDALYKSVTQGHKFPGVEHWLGLFYPRLHTLFDYLPEAPSFSTPNPTKQSNPACNKSTISTNPANPSTKPPNAPKNAKAACRINPHPSKYCI